MSDLSHGYEIYSDEELVRFFNSGESKCFSVIASRYTDKIRYIIRSVADTEKYGEEIEDLMQEAYIALYSAVKVYDFSSASFSTFASVCIKRSIISAVRRDSRKKRIPRHLLTTLDESDTSFSDNPELQFIDKENYEVFSDKLKSVLSSFEYSVLSSYLLTGDYVKTAVALGVDKKAVNNALFRARDKIRNISLS